MNIQIKKAIDLAGSQVELAKRLGVSQPRVWNWLNRDKSIPIEYVIPICEAVENQLSPQDFYPNIFGNKIA